MIPALSHARSHEAYTGVWYSLWCAWCLGSQVPAKPLSLLQVWQDAKALSRIGAYAKLYSLPVSKQGLTGSFGSGSIPCMAETPKTAVEIGAEIRRMRGEVSLTLQQLSERTGIAWQTLQAYETGRVMPPSDRLLAVLHAVRRASTPFRLPRVAAVCAAALAAAA